MGGGAWPIIRGLKPPPKTPLGTATGCLLPIQQPINTGVGATFKVRGAITAKAREGKMASKSGGTMFLAPPSGVTTGGGHVPPPHMKFVVAPKK